MFWGGGGGTPSISAFQMSGAYNLTLGIPVSLLGFLCTCCSSTTGLGGVQLVTVKFKVMGPAMGLNRVPRASLVILAWSTAKNKLFGSISKHYWTNYCYLTVISRLCLDPISTPRFCTKMYPNLCPKMHRNNLCPRVCPKTCPVILVLKQ